MEGVLRDLLVSISREKPDIGEVGVVHKLRDYLGQYSENCCRLKSELEGKELRIVE